MPSASICRSSRISTAMPASLARAAERAANSRGVSVLPGSFASSRARLLHSPSTRAPGDGVVKARAGADDGLPPASTTTNATPMPVRFGRLVGPAVELRQREPLRDGLRKCRGTRCFRRPRCRRETPTRRSATAWRARPRRWRAGVAPVPNAAHAGAHERNPPRARQEVSTIGVTKISNIALMNSVLERARVVSPEAALSSNANSPRRFALKPGDHNDIDINIGQRRDDRTQGAKHSRQTASGYYHPTVPTLPVCKPGFTIRACVSSRAVRLAWPLPDARRAPRGYGLRPEERPEAIRRPTRATTSQSSRSRPGLLSRLRRRVSCSPRN